MNKIFSKNMIAALSIAMIIMPMFLLALPVLAQTPFDEGLNYIENGNLGLERNADPRDAAVSLVRLLMTFLGIIAVVIMLYGGFMWMTAAGNDDKVAEAKKLIGAGIIGLIIILSAFIIVNFVVTNVAGTLNNS